MFVTIVEKHGKKNKAAYILWKSELLGHQHLFRSSSETEHTKAMQ